MIDVMALGFTVFAFAFSLLGGVIALRYKDKLNLILGLTAGILLGVVSFDIFPEIIHMIKETGVEPIIPMVSLVSGFLIFHILEKVLLIHHHHEDSYGHHKHPDVGVLSALAVAGHAFLDGAAIGLGFKISFAIGIPIALAVIAHAFSDGLNTVSLMLAHKNNIKKAFQFLVLVAFAPILGGFSTLLFTVSESFLLIYLGFFAGFLLYIGASDILPEAHSQRSSYKTIMMTILGVLLIFSISRFTAH